MGDRYEPIDSVFEADRGQDRSRQPQAGRQPYPPQPQRQVNPQQPWQQANPQQPWQQQPYARAPYQVQVGSAQPFGAPPGIMVNIGSPYAPPVDPGAQYADDCNTLGVVGLVLTFFLPFLIPTILSIIAFAKHAGYKRVGNGLNESKASGGFVCAIIALILNILKVGTVVLLIALGVIAIGSM